jgi:hypothetical protein
MKGQKTSRKNSAHRLATLFLVKNKSYLETQFSYDSAPLSDDVDEPFELSLSLESVSDSETATSS